MNNHTYRVGVMGASGYTGAELLRYLSQHPHLELVWATADRSAGKTIGEVFGHLVGFADVRLQEPNPATAPELDLVFLALPHGQAAEHGRTLSGQGIKVVDLSADWRLRDPDDYQQWYDWTHPAPAEITAWTYGLPELYREGLRGAGLVANPGCYPTAAILALAPLVRAGCVDTGLIVVNALSGSSGAGRKSDAAFSLADLDASCKAYGVGAHRHTPEIEQELSTAAGSTVRVSFTPHLVPMARGELVTCVCRLNGTPEAVRAALEDAYKAEPFVHVLAEGQQPATKQVSGSNHVLIGIGFDKHADLAIVTAVIDNLGKGAAGQAVQNANLMLDIAETTALTAPGVFP